MVEGGGGAGALVWALVFDRLVGGGEVGEDEIRGLVTAALRA
ncbi:hypothetical protein AB0C76_34965 [Kitasatospora sp. NPDC048722]